MLISGLTKLPYIKSKRENRKDFLKPESNLTNYTSLNHSNDYANLHLDDKITDKK